MVDFKDLKRLGNLFPYLETAVDASPKQIRQYFRSVDAMGGLSKGICVPSTNRNLIRSMIIKVFNISEYFYLRN